MNLTPLEQALGRAGSLIANVRADQMSDPTPCAQYDVRALINHLIEINETFADVVAGTPSNGATRQRDFVGDDPLGNYDRSKERLLRAFRRPDADERTYEFPFGRLSAFQAVGVTLMEVVVHGWDLARATGQDETIDPNVATALLAGFREALTEAFRNENGDPFGPPVDVPDAAPPHHKLVAFFGRTP